MLLFDNSMETGQRNSILNKLCRQAAEAKEAGAVIEMAMQTLEKELVADKDRQHQQKKGYIRQKARKGERADEQRNHGCGTGHPYPF